MSTPDFNFNNVSMRKLVVYLNTIRDRSATRRMSYSALKTAIHKPIDGVVWSPDSINWQAVETLCRRCGIPSDVFYNLDESTLQQRKPTNINPHVGETWTHRNFKLESTRIPLKIVACNNWGLCIEPQTENPRFNVMQWSTFRAGTPTKKE